MAKTYIDGRMIVNGNDSHTDVDNRRWLNSLLTYATTAEATAGTATNLVITPATLTAALGSIGDLDSVLANGNVTGANDIEVSNGQVIKAVNGGGELNLRNTADDVISLSTAAGGTIAISTDAGVFAESWLGLYPTYTSIGVGGNYLTIDANNVNGSLATGASYMGYQATGLVTDLTTVNYGIAVNDNTGGAVTFATSANSAVSVNSGITGTVTTVNTGIDNSAALGGIGITVKTANTAYVNQLGFCASGATFEGLLDTDTLTENRTYELPNSSGVVDITRTIGTAISVSANTGETLLCDAVGGQIFVTLPNPTGKNNLKITIKKIDATANKVSLVHAVGAIDGTPAGVNLDISTQWSSMTVVSYGDNWYKTAVI